MQDSCPAVRNPLNPLDERPAVVIDTQVVMDWLVFRDPIVRPLADAVLSGAVQWLVTAAMRDEIRHVLGRGVAARYAPDLADIEAHFDRHALWVEPLEPSPRLACRDPDDQKFIDLALARQARWLVSRDKALLSLARRALSRGVHVVKPQGWSNEAHLISAVPVNSVQAHSPPHRIKNLG